MSKVPRKRKVNIKGILRLLVLIIIIGFSIYKFVEWNFNREDVTYNLEIGDINFQNNYQALIIRKEIVLTSSTSGHILQVANEGEKVKRNQRVMEISKTDMAENPAVQTASENETIEIVSLNIDQLDEEVNRLTKEIAKHIEVKNYGMIDELSVELALKIDQRKRLLESNISPVTTETSVGNGELALGEKEIIKAKEAGILTYYIDGYEDDFTYEKVLSLNFDQVASLDIEPYLATGNYVESGDILCKIIDDSNYYLVIIVPPSDQNLFDSNQSIEVSVGDRNIRGTIAEILPAGKQIAIAIRVDEYIENFYKERMVNVSLKQRSQKGLLIHKTSLIKSGDAIGVYVVDKLGKVSFKPVKVVSYSGEQMVVKQDSFYETIDGEIKRIETVGLSDEVVIHAENYEPGDLVD